MHASTPSTPPVVGERALVLGGGGSTGNAWLIGVLAGLADGGVDVTNADLTIGTSAGATAAAQLGGASPAELYAAVLVQAPAHTAGPSGSGRPAPAGPVTGQLDRLKAIIAASADIVDLRRRIAGVTPESDPATDAERQARWRDTVAARLPSRVWPSREVLITAVDADAGEPVAFDRRSGIDLADAVAASCSNGFGLPPYRLGDRRYLDGGYRANAENADLAAGCERVLVLSPLGGRSLHPAAWGTHLADQVDGLRAGGSRVETIVPAVSTEHLFGGNAMNARARPDAARAGYAQGTAFAERAAALWR